MGVSRQWENQIDRFLQHPVVRELFVRYAEENPEATGNVIELVMHALIAPLCRGPKDKPDGWREEYSWTCLELLLGMPGGARLSPAECELVRQILSGERKRPARRRGPNTRRDDEMADYLELLEADGDYPKKRVARAMKVYGVSRGTVFAARKKRTEEMTLFEPKPEPKGRDMTAETRRNRIEFQEREAARKWHPRRS